MMGAEQRRFCCVCINSSSCEPQNSEEIHMLFCNRSLLNAAESQLHTCRCLMEAFTVSGSVRGPFFQTTPSRAISNLTAPARPPVSSQHIWLQLVHILKCLVWHNEKQHTLSRLLGGKQVCCHALSKFRPKNLTGYGIDMARQLLNMNAWFSMPSAARAE